MAAATHLRWLNRLVWGPTLFVSALLAIFRQRLSIEWSALSIYQMALDRPKTAKLGFTPRDFRPVKADSGRAVLNGRLTLAGQLLETGPHGDPWDVASPSRRFAVALHSFAWMPDLLATGEDGEREALRLVIAWRAEFKTISPFGWGWETLERRQFNLACAAQRLLPHASDLEARQLARLLVQQSRRLLVMPGPAHRRAERLVAAAVGAAALADPAGQSLLQPVMEALSRALGAAVLNDGGLHSRSPEQAMELLYDLLTLEDLMSQRGATLLPALVHAIDRLTSATRFFKLRDGRLAAFQGGEAAGRERVQAALVHKDAGAAGVARSQNGGYHLLSGRNIQVMVDAGTPATGAWSVTACDQPLAIEVLCGRDRLITNCGWSPAGPSHALRLSTAGSTVSIGGGSPGRLLSGLRRHGLGPRLVGAASHVNVRRVDDENGALIELRHDGWDLSTGALHERRLFLDATKDELRGEDRILRLGKDRQARPVYFSIRFHMPPDVQVSLARDKHSVLLRGASDKGWWFRNDAPEVSLEPTMICEGGQTRRSTQILLRGWLQPAEKAARVRWKLTAVDAEHETPPKAAQGPHV